MNFLDEPFFVDDVVLEEVDASTPLSAVDGR